MELPGLSFRPGVGVQAAVFQKFGLSVSPVGASPSVFFLVASFGRCKFKLCPLSVGLILQATIGGSASDFGVIFLSDRVFRFSVSSKSVGFHIFNLRRFVCEEYKIFFNLWGNGGPRWDLELEAFYREEAASWSLIKGRPSVHNAASFAEVVKTGILTGANSIPLRRSVFDRIQFPNVRPTSKQVHFARPSSVRVPNFQFQDRSQLNQGFAKSVLGHASVGQAKDQSSLNLNLNLGQPFSHQYPAKGSVPGICSRCLSNMHPRRACKSPIRCFACMGGGHIAVNCPDKSRLSSKFGLASSNFNGKPTLEQPNWFSKVARESLGPGTSSPPSFASFAEWWMTTNVIDPALRPPEPILVPWKLASVPMFNGPAFNQVHSLEGHLNLEIGLTMGNSSSPPDNSIPNQVHQTFDFFGLGQQVPDQPNEHHQALLNQGLNEATPAQDVNEPQLIDGASLHQVLPTVQNAPAAQVMHFHLSDLNLAPLALEQDLNEIPMIEDPQAIIFHPDFQTMQVQATFEEEILQQVQQLKKIGVCGLLQINKDKTMPLFRFRIRF